MIRVSELRARDVVNTVDGRRLGVIKDIDLDLEEGKVRGLILPGTGRFSFFGRNEDIVVPWERIRVIGVDCILVDIPSFTEVNKAGS